MVKNTDNLDKKHIVNAKETIKSISYSCNKKNCNKGGNNNGATAKQLQYQNQTNIIVIR